jgi:hypothetical protein
MKVDYPSQSDPLGTTFELYWGGVGGFPRHRVAVTREVYVAAYCDALDEVQGDIEQPIEAYWCTMGRPRGSKIGTAWTMRGGEAYGPEVDG